MNFLLTVVERIFSDTPPLAAPFREGCSIHLANEQKLRLPENERKECRFPRFLLLPFRL